MEADGPVYYTTPQQTARGDHATYDAASNLIVMTGNVVLVQDKNVVQGERLVVDTDTNHSQLYPGRARHRIDAAACAGSSIPARTTDRRSGRAPPRPSPRLRPPSGDRSFSHS